MKSKNTALLFAIGVVALCFAAGFALNKYAFKKKTVHKAVYFWKNTFTTTENDSKVLRQLGITKIYCKVLDIDWNLLYHAYPISQTVFKQHSQPSQEFIPVVFITNRTMLKCEKHEIPELAKKLWKKIAPLSKTYGFKIEEIQLDCDWSSTSKDNYFILIKELKRISKKKISSTIRLHQYKYPAKTGVPPADKGMLMCYNIGDLKNIDTENSIYTEEEAKKYFSNTTEYPLPLDIALPTFSWGVLFRQNQFAAIIDELSEEKINNLSYLQPIKPNFYQVTKDTVLERPEAFDDIYLRNGDIIRYENIDAETFSSAAAVSKGAVNTNNLTVAFFSYDTTTINTMGRENYEKAFNTFIW